MGPRDIRGEAPRRKVEMSLTGHRDILAVCAGPSESVCSGCVRLPPSRPEDLARWMIVMRRKGPSPDSPVLRRYEDHSHAISYIGPRCCEGVAPGGWSGLTKTETKPRSIEPGNFRNAGSHGAYIRLHHRCQGYSGGRRVARAGGGSSTGSSRPH